MTPCTEISVYKTYPGFEAPWCADCHGWHTPPVTYTFPFEPVGDFLLVSAAALEAAIVAAIDAVEYCEKDHCWKWCPCPTEAPPKHTHKPAMQQAVHEAIARLKAPAT